MRVLPPQDDHLMSCFQHHNIVRYMELLFFAALVVVTVQGVAGLFNFFK
jgi:hypothetical protein